MKKVFIFIAVLLLLAACAAVWVFGAPEGIEPIEPREGRDYACASLTYDEGLRLFSGTQTIIAANRSDEMLEEIVLRLPMNALDGASCSISGVHVNGMRRDFFQDQDDETILTIQCGWQPEECIELSFSLMVKHPAQEGTSVVTLPYLAMRENGAWRTDAYDGLAGMGYAHAFDACVTVDGVCAASLRGARDMSFALPGGAVRGAEVSGVHIRALAGDAGAAGALIRSAKAAIKSLNEAGIAYPYDVLTVADGQTRRADGEACSGLIVLSADADGETLLRRMTRLIAQQTFGVFVESDPWNSPWLSESLASAAEMLAYEKRKGTAAYEARLYEEMEIASRVTRPHGVNIGAGTAHFGGDAEMTQVLRDAGGAMLLGLREAMGGEAFVTALSLYAEDCGGGVAVQADFERALKTASGADWSGYLADGLSY